jgi:hypothetical protein
MPAAKDFLVPNDLLVARAFSSITKPLRSPAITT